MNLEVKTNDLVGKFVYMSVDDYYSTGQIVGKGDGDFYLVKKDSMFPTQKEVTMLFSAVQMIPQSEADVWFFFDTREELDEHLKWLEEDDGDKKTNKVIKLVKE